MDVLDSLDLDTKVKKSRRVRSWYLYEQYRALEKHQLDAAQKLKDRSYQDKILRQELLERRARRKLYDQFGLCQSESRLQKINNNANNLSTLSSVSNDEFFESLSFSGHECKTDEIDFDCSQELISVSKSYTDDFKGTDDQRDVSDSGSVNSVVENIIAPNDDDCNEYPESENSTVENLVPLDVECNDCDCECELVNDLDTTTVIIAQDINKQLDSIKDDIQRLEDITKLDDEKTSDVVSECSTDICRSMMNTPIENKEHKDKIIPIWSRLVSFAYQIVQMNHGNCYCDYSSQFLTAVLACDVLRLGVIRMFKHGTFMCSSTIFQNLSLIGNILQPYVSPINFVTNKEKTNSYYKYVKTKKSEQSTKASKISEVKPSRRMNRYNNSSRKLHVYRSENCWQSCHRQLSFEHRPKTRHPRRASQPWRSDTNCPYTETVSTASSSVWPQMDRRGKLRNMFEGCPCCKKAVNPMLKIARYIDSILKDMNYTKHI